MSGNGAMNTILKSFFKNTKRFIEEELAGADYTLPYILWPKEFIEV